MRRRGKKATKKRKGDQSETGEDTEGEENVEGYGERRAEIRDGQRGRQEIQTRVHSTFRANVQQPAETDIRMELIDCAVYRFAGNNQAHNSTSRAHRHGMDTNLCMHDCFSVVKSFCQPFLASVVHRLFRCFT